VGVTTLRQSGWNLTVQMLHAEVLTDRDERSFGLKIFKAKTRPLVVRSTHEAASHREQRMCLNDAAAGHFHARSTASSAWITDNSIASGLTFVRLTTTSTPPMARTIETMVAGVNAPAAIRSTNLICPHYQPRVS
jgi:hypothetical protein